MKKPRRKPTKRRKPVSLDDLRAGIEKMHFHTEAELLALVRFYAKAVLEIAETQHDLHQMRYDLIRYANRMVRLAQELP